MLLQQFGGSNGILFYASSIFEAAGTCVRFIVRVLGLLAFEGCCQNIGPYICSWFIGFGGFSNYLIR